MRPFLLLISSMMLVVTAFARHGKGGSITYEYIGQGSLVGSSKYRITAKHYIDCDGTQFIESESFVGIFNAGNGGLIKTLTIPQTSQIIIQKADFNPCISQPPKVCYVVVTYVAETELADSPGGFVITEQECCRIGGIINIPNSASYGITNTNVIPGIINGVDYHTNNSPVFAQKDTVVICHNAFFSLDFGATDKDGDQLTYAFTAAKSGGNMQTRQPNPPTGPPYADVPYQAAFSALLPLGSRVTIDSKTGMISGIAPGTLGSYVIAVNVFESRNGVLIGTSKKEVQVTVADCSLSAAALKPSYINCDDFTFTFRNESTSNNASRYFWDFGVTGSTTDVSTSPTPVFTYPDTGRFVLRLKVQSVAGCEDSTVSDVIVYPGFTPAFRATGSCFETPFEFTDLTTTRYGEVNNWQWDFGDNYTAANMSAAPNPTHAYNTLGSYQVTLTVGTSKGCLDTAIQTVVVSDKPLLTLPFSDTLICSIDTLLLRATGTGNFSWSPGVNILNSETASPLVFPKVTSDYVVTLNEKGCVAKDTIRVNVLDGISVTLPADTTICQTDSILLRPVSAGLQYQWLPAIGLNNALLKNPHVAPQADQVYQVVANLGKCQATTSTRVHVVPYPAVAAGNDTIICYGTFAQLRASVTASSYTWSPLASLQDAGTLTPVARPLQATRYVLTAYDVIGCPKPSRDTVLVSVLPRIPAFAGNDTVVVAGQPLQLQATGGSSYQWSPATGLSNPFLANPVARLGTATDSISYSVRVSKGACSANDVIKITVFKTLPEIFVPSAFTPNSDGSNDVLKPILAGIKRLDSFKVFNRWGQLVYSTSEPSEGWNGNLHGVPQQSGTFVYLVAGITYLDQKIMKKGTVVLIR